MTEAHDFHLPITAEADLKLFLKLAWGVEIPDVQVCANHSTPWRAFADAYFARHPAAVWLASRGFGGKSFLLALLGLTEAVTLHADVNVLGGSGEQSVRVLSHMTKFWFHEDAPRDRLASEPAKQITRLVDGTTIQALTASQRSVRGPHPQRLRLDEVDEFDMDILEAALGQPMAKQGVKSHTVFSSTRQYVDGPMTQMMRRAGKAGWPIHEWCYKETSAPPSGWLMPSEVEEKRKLITAAMWEAEYDLAEPNPAARAIQPDAVRHMFDKDLGTYQGELYEYIEIEEPVPGATYGTGADWARKQDFTIIVTFRLDVAPAKMVAYERTGRLDWPVMLERFNARLRRFPGSAYHDATGIGDVINSYIEVPSNAVILSGQTRANMLTGYISAVETGEIKAPFIQYAFSEHLYAGVGDVYAGGEGHLPDTIAACALAWLAARYRGASEEDIIRIGSNEIHLEGIPADQLEAARMSGLDLEQFRRK